MALSKGAKVALSVLPALLAVGGLTVGAKPAARWLMHSTAQRAGIHVDKADLTLGWGSVRLTNAAGGLTGIPGIHWSAKTVLVKLSWFTPTYISASGVQLDLRGSPISLALDTQSWLRDHNRTGNTAAVPMDIRGMRATWAPKAGRSAWLTGEGMTMRRRPGQGTVTFGSVIASGAAVGGGNLSWSQSSKGTTWTLKPTKGMAIATVFIDNQGTNAKATWRTIPAQDLAASLDLPWTGRDDASISGEITARLPKRAATAPVQGTFRVVVDGYVPPHAPQLNGILYGRTTKLSSSYSLDRRRRTVTLNNSRVTVGSLILGGGGRVTWTDSDATLGLTLHGKVACAMLAKSAIESGLQGAVGNLLGGAVAQALTGQVTVTLNVQGSTKQLDSIRFEPVLGIGCGLRGLGR